MKTKDCFGHGLTCAAVGSFHNLENERPRSFYKDVMNFFQTNTYHPVRKLVYDNQHLLSGYITCAIAPFREGRIGFLRKLDVKQKSYFPLMSSTFSITTNMPL